MTLILLNKTSATGQSGTGIVRVIQRRTAERVLLKGFTGKVLDVAFAHLPSVVLGAVDQVGNLFVYEILDNPDGKVEYPFRAEVGVPMIIVSFPPALP